MVFGNSIYLCGLQYLQIIEKHMFICLFVLKNILVAILPPIAVNKVRRPKLVCPILHKIVNNLRCFCNNQKIIDRCQHPLSDKLLKC